MTRARLCLLLPILSMACERAGQSPTTSPSDATTSNPADAAELSGNTLPIVAVRQRVLSPDPSQWRFDPSGRLIAEEFIDDDLTATGCGIWDIESGTFMREHIYQETDEEDAFDPCYDWGDDPRLLPTDTSADGKLRADVIGGLEIEVIDGPTRTVRGCASCDDVFAWAPSGHQLATCNGTLLEIWDADTGTKLRSETLGLGDVIETLIGWTEAGIGVVVLHQITARCSELEPEGSYCNYEGYDEETEDYDRPIDGYALSSFWWPAEGGPPLADVAVYKSAEMPDFYADAGVRWLALSRYVDYDRDGSSTTVHVHGVGPRTSALGWTESDEDGPWTELWEGHWRVDAASQWIEGWTVNESGDYYGDLEVGWSAIVAEPNPAVFRGKLTAIEGPGPWAEVEVFAASGGAAVANWEACVDDGEQACKTGGPPVGDCELLDVSPLLSLALVHCDAGLKLIEAGGRGSTVISLPHDPDSDWRWGRGNHLALLEPDGKLDVIDLGTGKSLHRRADVLELLEVPLAPEQDRLALGYADHLEIVAGPSGARIIEVPGDWSAAALSPDGKQLATLGGGQVHVIDIDSGATISKAPVDDAFWVAWRQDGAALFYGYDWPTHAINPSTGELLYPVEHPIIDMLDVGEIDPSWRWIHRPDGSITRVLDFARIELGPSWARLDSGVFEGELDELPDGLRFRIGTDPNVPASYTVADLEPWLRSRGLVQAFFAGKPLPSPRVPVEALAKLEGGKRNEG